jgi:hypothetical protein
MSETQQECTGIALAVGSVRGLRSFNVDHYGRLTAVARPTVVWKPGENVAVCNRSAMDFVNTLMRQAAHPYAGGFSVSATGTCPGIAHPLCTCGFYAYHDGSKYQGGQVTGVIDGYGKTTVGTKGFRCEKARVVALCVEGTRKAGWSERLFMAGWATSVIALGAWFSEITDHPSRWYLYLAAFLVFALSVFNYVRWQQTRSRRRLHNERIAPLRDLIARNYADVPLYDDVKSMTRDFPPDRGESPSPDNDPEFWERSS